MEIAQLKKEIHDSVEKLDDEGLLLEIIDVLKKGGEGPENSFDYEESAVFQNALNESLEDLDNGNVFTHEQVMQHIKTRSWRSK